MNAIRYFTLWQPWASGVPYGWKWNETRGFKTQYRGDLAIHAAKQDGTSGNDILTLAVRKLRAAGLDPGDFSLSFPRGVVVAVVELWDIVPTEEIRGSLSPLELQFGDYSDGRYAWRFRNIRPTKPLKLKGAQGLRWMRPEDQERLELLPAIPAISAGTPFAIG
jgi:hypothetical protein